MTERSYHRATSCSLGETVRLHVRNGMNVAHTTSKVCGWNGVDNSNNVPKCRHFETLFRKLSIVEREMFYLTHVIYGYLASGIWLRTILIAREETRCRHMGYSFRLAARILLYAPSDRQDSTYHSLCYTSRGALAGTRNSSMGPPHEGLIRRPIVKHAARCVSIIIIFFHNIILIV